MRVQGALTSLNSRGDLTKCAFREAARVARAHERVSGRAAVTTIEVGIRAAT